MSRSTVRILTLLTAIAIPSMAQAQVSCNIQPGSASPCTAAMTSSLTVPTLARISATGDSLSGSTLTLTSPDWASFLATPAATSTLSQVALNVRANTSFTVGISAPSAWTVPSGGSRELSTLTYASAAGACPAVGTITTEITGSAVTLTSGSATASAASNLCIALSFPGSLAAGELVPGAYSLPITLTLTAP